MIAEAEQPESRPEPTVCHFRVNSAKKARKLTPDTTLHLREMIRIHRRVQRAVSNVAEEGHGFRRPCRDLDIASTVSHINQR
jgi:hypothetical protein